MSELNDPAFAVYWIEKYKGPKILLNFCIIIFLISEFFSSSVLEFFSEYYQETRDFPREVSHVSW